MTFGFPRWLLLLPVLVAAAWVWRPLGLRRPLRFLCLGLLVLVLAEPRSRGLAPGLDLWVVVDRSASARGLIAPRIDEIESLLRKSAGSHDRLFFVDYAEEPVLRGDNPEERFAGPVEGTDTALALRYALARMDPDRAARILLLTDGFSTSPLGDVSERLIRQGVPLDTRIFFPETARDHRITDFRIPARVQIGEPFLLDIRVAGPDGEIPLAIFRDGSEIGRETVEIRDGHAVIRLTDRIARAGACRYRAEIRPAGDAFPGNNHAEGWIEVVGGPRILLLTAYGDDPLALVLRAQGFEIERIDDPGRIDLGRLSGARAVVLNNVPAYRIAPEFLESLDVFVRMQGGGLLMAGGKHSFGSGGYFESPIDGLLPVSMELRQEHRKLSTAVAVVLDRSGSMGVGVAGGVTKMDLADEGAARCVELLGDNDAVTVFAVDSTAHMIVPLSAVGPNRSRLQGRIRGIASMGGGIFVYTGLAAAWEELRRAEQGTKHVILFADAADSEEPGRYRELIREMTDAGATVSVIGLGEPSDSDAAFLMDIAARGNGRIFFNADPTALPALFAQETVAVARSAFLDEPVGITPTAGWLEIAARLLEWPEAVDGYNLAYLRDEATAAALTSDEYAAPLTAFWQRGAGRVAAVCFPLGGEYSERIRAWPRYGDFNQTLVRWIMGEDLPPGIGLRTAIDGTILRIELLFDETWEKRFLETPPKIFLAEEDGRRRSLRSPVWERIEPGLFRASEPLSPGIRYRGSVRIGPYTIPFGPLAVAVSPEWRFDPRRVEELRAASKQSGGRERIDLAAAWERPETRGLRDLRPWFLVAFLIVFLAEALQSRVGRRMPEIPKPAEIAARASARLSRGIRRRAAARRSAARPAEPEEPVAPAAASPAETPRNDRDARRSRFRRAKGR